MCQNINANPANIILDQLGGRNRLKAMLGAKNFFSNDDGYSLVFQIGRGAKNNIKNIKITLDPLDTYTVVFTAVSKKKDIELKIFIPLIKEVSVYSGIYCNMLKDLIENETGFYLSL